MGSLLQLKIPRKVLPTHLYDEALLQVFCDASEKAYGACVYLVPIKGALSLQPSFLPNARGGADQTINSPSSRAPGNTHWCQTCNSGQGGTIRIEARTEHLSVVLRLNDRTLIDKRRIPLDGTQLSPTVSLKFNQCCQKPNFTCRQKRTQQVCAHADC